MDLGLKGKIAIVSGSSRGMGFSIARLLAQEGARVVVNSRTKENVDDAANQIRAQTGAQVLVVTGDVAEPGNASALIDQTVDHFGGIDILVTNTGGTTAGHFDSFSDADWQKAVELLLFSHVRLIRAALPHLRKSVTAAVLTLTSYVVKQPLPDLVLSNSIRSATVGLTKSLALELGGEGIRFNSILPGWTATERVNELLSKRASLNNTSLEEEIEKQTREISLGRMALPEEIARAAVFLVSPAASYITGVMLNVDGGATKGF